MKTLPRLTRPTRSVLLALAVLLLTACQPGVQRTDIDFGQAQLNWSRFIELSEKAGPSAKLPGDAASPATPFSAVLSIRYKTPAEGYRFAAYFWGNLRDTSVYPVRLDVQGFMGATVAKLVEDKRDFLLYDTENNIAHIAEGTQQSLLHIGLPLPMRLGDLALLLNGRYQDFFLPGQDATMPKVLAGNSLLEYTYELRHGPRSGEFTINSQGQPISWQEAGGQIENGWRFDFAYPEGTQSASLPGPYKVQASHPAGYAITLQIKSLTRPDKIFSPDQLNLLLPTDTKIEKL
ncbi:MAG: hypothetical protein LBV80_07080 [Deltaproteobacteria bacterium]|jgi:outer membrane biogenesis lipoprotein LolB|nr:hypothetical protein [Deltaproteobacteria bacterium]